MTKVRRVDFYPDDFLVGIIGMPPDEIGAYWVVCSLIYSRGGPIADDPQWLATACNCHLKTWKRLRDSLLNRGKLVAKDGQLSNKRAANELQRASNRAETARQNGRYGGRPAKENNDIGKATGLEPGIPDPKTNKQQPAASSHQTSSSSQQPGVPSPAAPRAVADPNELGEAACRAAGIDPAKLPADFGTVTNWLAWKYDPEREILPAIRAVAARPGYRPPRNLRYFNEAIADYRATLRTPPPKGEARANGAHGGKRDFIDDGRPIEGSLEWWDNFVGLWKQHRHRPREEWPWKPHDGPAPGEPGCRAPAEILRKHGIGRAA